MTYAPNGDAHIDEPSRLNRYQRALVMGTGIAISFVLVLLTGVVLHSAVAEYIEDRYRDFSLRQTRLQLEFLERERTLRAAILHEESGWGTRPLPPAALIDEFAAQHGQVILQRHANFDPVMMLGDVGPSHPASDFAPYLALGVDFHYRVGPWAKVQTNAVSGYFYSPDRRFVGILPAPASGNPVKQSGTKDVHELLDRIAPDIGDLTDPTVIARLREGEGATWFPPAKDPFGDKPAIRLVMPAFSEGKIFLVAVRKIYLGSIIEILAGGRYDEESLLLDSAGNVILSTATPGTGAALTQRILESRPQAAERTGERRRYRNRLFMASAEVTNSGWTIVYAFTWRTILRDLGPRLAAYITVMLLVLGFMWLLLLMLDHKLFKPDYERSQRVFESEALNRTMVAAAPSGFALLSFEQGDILLQSNLMRTYELNTHPDDPRLHERLLGLYDRSPGAPAWQSDLEMPLRLADGRVDDLLVSIVRTKYRGKDVLLCSFSDVTTLKNTERKLDEARAAADAANQAKSAFLAMMSHEIRTPLNAILGNLELLGRSPLSPLQEERVGVVTSSSTALLGIINDILDFSKVESGQMTLESISFDLAQLIREVAAMFEPVAQAKGLEFDCVIDDALAPHYLGDPTRIRQIVINLVSNAIKFTATGDVLLEVYLKDDTADDSPIVIGVSDTGIGMTPQQQESLFHAFTQADSSIARRYGGTGLGLALCLRLTDLMHGTIWVKSELHAGSTFVVTLPIPVSADSQVSAAGHTKAESKSTEIDANAIHILVVDDQLANRELLVAQLATLGYEADMADSGGAALRRFNERHYDLVMTDINMPGMDGYALARCLRAQSATVPIIAITAHVAAEVRAQCTNAGIDEVLLKPVLLDTMDAMVRRLVDEAARRLANDTMARRDISQGPLPEHIHAAMTQALKDSLRELHAAVEVRDVKTVLAQLHAVRGSFAMIQETEVANACAQMEQQARNNDIAAVKDGLDRFEPLAYSALARRAIGEQSDA
ncbi:two-component system capsular synthesis sensor histidine kinase RcsC [Paraburkholderia atlantica]|uniref:hybrid sensor histidine kinase/response regulator n=1 Tax=Paraburkholderia atlantica TaxID=2654982 RepID=UPI003D1C60FB